jgi:hypothetical protein
VQQGVEWVLHTLAPTCNENDVHFDHHDPSKLASLLKATYHELFDTFLKVTCWHWQKSYLASSTKAYDFNTIYSKFPAATKSRILLLGTIIKTCMSCASSI